MMNSESPDKRAALAALAAAGCLMLLFGWGYRVVAARLDAPVDTVPISPETVMRFPLQINDWTGEDVPMDEAIVLATDTDARVNRRYRRGGSSEVVSFYLASGVQARDLTPHRPQVCYIGAGWTLTSSHRMVLPLSDSARLPCNVLQFSRGDLNPESVVVLNYYLVDGEYCADVSALRSKAWRGSGTVRYVAQIQVATSITATVPAEEAVKTVCNFAIASASPVAALFDDLGTK